MTLNEYLPMIEVELSALFKEHGFVDRFVRSDYRCEKLFFASGQRLLVIDLEIREGVLDLWFGSRDCLYFIDQVPRYHYWRMVSLERELRASGIKVPWGHIDLYKEGVFEYTLMLLIREALKRPSLVLGV